MELLEGKSIPGGRASSYEAQDTGEPVDNCQHVLMGCCTNLLQFYEHAGVRDRIAWIDAIRFLATDGNHSVLRASRLPAPFHLMPSFFRLGFLSASDKVAIGSALFSLLAPAPPRDEPLAAWLTRRRQPHRAISRFWRPIVVSALNEEPERCSFLMARKIFREGFLSHPRAYEMGIPRVPLLDLYRPCVAAIEAGGGTVRFRARARGLRLERGMATGVATTDGVVDADYVISTLPWDAAGEVLGPAAGVAVGRAAAELQPSPISAVHLWWDREVTTMPHAALLDREVQWMFNKTSDYARDGGTHMGLVVSASRDWLPRGRREILALAEAEMRAAFPGTAGASVRHSALIKEARATFSPAPGVDAIRPGPDTALPNLFIGGDWTRTGWPSTMEGAVRGGLLAAEGVLAAEGRPETLLAPDLPWLSRLGRPDTARPT